MNSPTTLLNSIQFMKNKLRSDKQLLQDIKKDFNLISKNRSQTIIEDEQHHQIEETKKIPMRDITNCLQDRKKQRDDRQRRGIKCEREQGFRQSHSIDDSKTNRNRISELRKQHQRQLVRIKEQFERQKQLIIVQKNEEIEEIHNKYERKLIQQANYIAILQEQVSSPIQSQRDRASIEQYETIINGLMKENTKLVQKLSNMKKEVFYYAQKYKQVSQNESQNQMDKSSRSNNRINISCQPSNQNHNYPRDKSRLKFGKVKTDQSRQFASERSEYFVDSHHRANSVYLYNDENLDISNKSHIGQPYFPANKKILSDVPFSSEDELIEQDEGKMRTIRGFVSINKSGIYVHNNEENNRESGGYLSLKI